MQTTSSVKGLILIINNSLFLIYVRQKEILKGNKFENNK
jgi:hypothetical protein